MKKLFLLGAMVLSALTSWAQTSPYTGVAPGDIVSGESYYLYNVDFGKWLGDNDRNRGYGWTSHAEIGTRGRDIKFITNDDGWQLDPKLGNNHSINSGNLYMDTGAEKTKWMTESLDNGISNAVRIKAGDKGLSANNAGDMDENSEAGNNHNNWQIVTAKERWDVAVAKAGTESSVDVSWAILGGTFPVADDHRNGTWVGGCGDSNGDGTDIQWNRICQKNGVSDWDLYQDINVPNGVYEVYANAVYVSTPTGDMSASRYNNFLNGTEPTKGVLYANGTTTPMVNAYEMATNKRVDGKRLMDLGNGKWVANGPSQYSKSFAYDDAGRTQMVRVTVTDGKLRVGLKVQTANNATVFYDNFRLIYCGEELNKTLELAESEGIDPYKALTSDSPLRTLRNLRKLNAIEKVDITKIECSEPAEGDFYIYNVGAGIFFSTTADWGTHIALDNPGMLVKFVRDGERDGLPNFKLSGNGWDGLNWNEEYWDKNGEHLFHFTPVDGKDKVYTMNVYDNHSWHFVYDPAEDVCDQNTHYWNSVQKRNWNRADYVDNPYAQWMLVSPEAYKAAMKKATPSNPLDVTFLIENPNFTKAKVPGVDGEGKPTKVDNWTRGWTGVGTTKPDNHGRDPWCVIEWYQANANMKQTLSNLRPGKYEVSCYGFYRDGGSDNEAGKVGRGEEPIKNAFLVANDERAALPNVTSEAGMMPGVGETRTGVDGEFVIWPWQANEYFQSGLYKATVPVVVGADGQLTIGIESTYNDVTGSWVVVGNFRLDYLGGYVELDEASNTNNVKPGHADVVTVKRTISTDKWNTFCVPFAMAKPDGWTVKELSDVTVNGENYSMVFGDASSIEAGKPYMVQVNEAVTEITATDVTLAAVSPVTINGLTFTGAYESGNAPEGSFIISNNKFYEVNSEVALKAFRGYITVDAGSQIKALNFFLEDDATGIEMAPAATEGEEIYNLAGQKMSKMQKGINIVNGKKVLK